jgi:hypothetical protein
MLRSSPASRPGEPGSGRARLDPRDQARRLPPDRPARRQARAAVHPQRPRLDRALSADRRGRAAQPQFEFLRHRWRGGAARRRRHLRFQRPALRRHDDEVQLYAFDILALEGEDLRKLPLHLRKNQPGAAAGAPADGIFVSEFEQRRDRAGPVPQGLRVRARGPGLEAPRQPYRAGRVAELDQGQEPQASGDAPGQWKGAYGGQVRVSLHAPPQGATS